MEFAGGDLRIRASRPHTDDANWAIDYRRTFTIGPEVDVDEISAEYASGVLQVRLPKLESAKPRQIAIRSV